MCHAEVQTASVGEVTFFMASAEASDSADTPSLAVHSLVGILKVLLDLVVIHTVVLVISVVAHLQNAFMFHSTMPI